MSVAVAGGTTTGAQLLVDLMAVVRTGPTDVIEAPRSPRAGSARRVAGRQPVPESVVSSALPVVEPSRTLDDVLRARRSERFFTDRPVALDELSEALSTALTADADLWPADTEWASAPQLLVVALRVDGLPPGLYRFDPRTVSYALLAALDRDAVAAMVLQAEYADAPVIVAAVGSPHDALFSRGDHGLRLLHLRAGAVCYGTYLAALRRGLSGSVFAGFLPSGLSRHLVADGYHLSQVFAVALGHIGEPPLSRA